MKVSQINQTNFKAGTVNLNRIAEKELASLGAIKKFAEEKNVDVFISKNTDTKYLPDEDMYLVMITKKIPVVMRTFFPVGNITKQSTGCVVTKKKISAEELSVKIFNLVMSTIENLEKKMAEFKVI